MRLASSFNFYNYRSAKQIIYFPSEIAYTSPNYVLEDLSSAESDSPIYMTPHGYSNYLIYSTNAIYLNQNCVGMAKGLTQLSQTDFFNTQCFNYKYVRNMHTMFADCQSLLGHPVGPSKATSLYGTYYNCGNLTGRPKIGANTNNLIATYYNCTNLSGALYDSPNVISMTETYYNCYNLSGSCPADIGASSLYGTFYNCQGLSGNPANCNNAYITINTYYGCENIYGSFYWCVNSFKQAEKVNMTNMFYGRSYSKQLNIYVYENYAIANAILNYSDTHGNLYGTGAITWTETGPGTFYNQTYNTQVILLSDSFSG